MTFFKSKKQREFIRSLKADVREYSSVDLTQEQKRTLDAKRIQRDWKMVGEDLKSVIPDK